MGDNEEGRGEDPPALPDDDPFAQLLDPGFAGAPAPPELSAEERGRQAQREARAADLRRRLAEEQEHERQLADRDRKERRRASAGHRRSKALGAVIVVGLVGGLVYLVQRGTSGDDVATGEDTSTTVTAPRPEGYPPIDRSASTTPLGTPPPLPAATGPFEFLEHQDGTQEPVAWDPCRPVRYVVNPAGAPPGTDALLQQAIANTAAATGLQFESAGTTTETWDKERDPYQPERYGKKWAPALIAWSDATATPGLGGYIAGLGGGIARWAPDGQLGYVSGELVLDREDLGTLMAQPDGPDHVRAIIQHEIGHMMGLDHVSDPRELMYTEGSPAQTSNWGPGDLHGLKALGTGACIPAL